MYENNDAELEVLANFQLNRARWMQQHRSYPKNTGSFTKEHKNELSVFDV